MSLARPAALPNWRQQQQQQQHPSSENHRVPLPPSLLQSVVVNPSSGHAHNDVHHGHGHSQGHSHGNGHGHSHGKPSSVPRRSLSLRQLLFEVRRTVLHPSAHRTSALLAVNVAAIALLSYWCAQTNSLALTSYTYICLFHVLSLCTCYVGQWVSRQGGSLTSLRRGVSKVGVAANGQVGVATDFSLGRARLEVLAIFAATVLAQLAAMFAVKESLERILEPPQIHTGRLLPGAFVCLATQLLTTYVCVHPSLTHVATVSASSWLQEHTADLAHSLCSWLPPLTSLLLPRIHPMSLLAVAGFVLVGLTDLIVQINDAHAADCLLSLLLAFTLLGTMYPMSMYTGKILLQTTPTHVVPQLERYLREALTIDGVLEFKNEHFWTVSFGKLAGSITVRVRKDADEQRVLAQITSRLSDLVWPLTVQISKDNLQQRLQQTSMQFLRSQAVAAAGSRRGGGFRSNPAGLEASPQGSPSPNPLGPGLSPVGGGSSGAYSDQRYLSPSVVGVSPPADASSFRTSTPKSEAPAGDAAAAVNFRPMASAPPAASANGSGRPGSRLLPPKPVAPLGGGFGAYTGEGAKFK